MPRYRITFDNGHEEIIEADSLEPSGDHFVGWAGDGSAVAYIPRGNVLLVVRVNDSDA
jgi:hypothetical protein